jgi:hypothetical protein
MTWLVNALGGGVSLGFMLFEGHGSVWSVLGGLAFIGGVVVGFDELVRGDLIRPWVPPLAVFGFACAAFTLLIADQDPEWREAAITGAALGAVVGCAFRAWWCGAAGTSRMRHARAGGQRRGACRIATNAADERRTENDRRRSQLIWVVSSVSPRERLNKRPLPQPARRLPGEQTDAADEAGASDGPSPLDLCVLPA